MGALAILEHLLGEADDAGEAEQAVALRRREAGIGILADALQGLAADAEPLGQFALRPVEALLQAISRPASTTSARSSGFMTRLPSRRCPPSILTTDMSPMIPLLLTSVQPL